MTDLSKRGLSKAEKLKIWRLWHEGRKVHLKIERVDYYSNEIIFSGPIITQKGEVGKREESIRINICKGSDDEHK